MNSGWDYTNFDFKVLPRCRTCLHTDATHYPKLGVVNKPPYPCREQACKCKEFLPQDNLKYLEYMEEVHGQKAD